MMKSLLPGLWTGGRALSDPFADMRREMDSFFNRSGRAWPTFETGFAMPSVNIAETPDAIEVTAELPGVDEKDISIDLDGSRLVISGEKKAEEKKEDNRPKLIKKGEEDPFAPTKEGEKDGEGGGAAEVEATAAANTARPITPSPRTSPRT